MSNIRRHFLFGKSLFRMVLPFSSKWPHRLTILVNNRCNSKCTTCYIWKNKDTDLEKKHILKFIDESFQLAGPQIITLSGGEPLLRTDIFEIIFHIHKKGGGARILTNGLLLTNRIIEKLVENSVSSICISLNGIDEGHDKSRGVKGNFEKIDRAVSYIREKHPNLSIDFTFILFKENIDQIIPTIEYARSVNAAIHFQLIHPIFDGSRHIGKEKAREIYHTMMPKDIKRFEDSIKTILTYRNKGYDIRLPDSFAQKYKKSIKNSGAKNKNKIRTDNIVLLNTGDITFQYGIPALGNIRNQNLKSILTGKQAMEQRNMKFESGACICELNPTFSDILKAGIGYSKKLIRVYPR